MLSPGCDHRLQSGTPEDVYNHPAIRPTGVGLRLEPGGCHLFPAGDSGTSAVKEYASA